jgi:hypothetical protein
MEGSALDRHSARKLRLRDILPWDIEASRHRI